MSIANFLPVARRRLCCIDEHAALTASAEGLTAGVVPLSTAGPTHLARFDVSAGGALTAAGARLLEREHEMLVVCDGNGPMTGILTRSDVVRQIGVCTGASCTAPISHALTREIITASPKDDLKKAWQLMQDRRLKNLPVIDSDCRPLGVLNARDVLERLWDEVRHEEELLFNYVMNIGYR